MRNYTWVSNDSDRARALREKLNDTMLLIQLSTLVTSLFYEQTPAIFVSLLNETLALENDNHQFNINDFEREGLLHNYFVHILMSCHRSLSCQDDTFWTHTKTLADYIFNLNGNGSVYMPVGEVLHLSRKDSSISSGLICWFNHQIGSFHEAGKYKTDLGNKPGNDEYLSKFLVEVLGVCLDRSAIDTALKRRSDTNVNDIVDTVNKRNTKRKVNPGASERLTQRQNGGGPPPIRGGPPQIRQGPPQIQR